MALHSAYTKGLFMTKRNGVSSKSNGNAVLGRNRCSNKRGAAAAASFRPRLSALLVNRALLGGIAGIAALQVFSWTSPAFALPSGGIVAAGTAIISQPNARTLQINQSTQKAILNWQGFSIGGNETVNFRQPNASSVALNRVLSNQPSEIFGRLTATGQVFLVNPNGVFFSPSASVDVGGIVAATLNIRDADFLSGNYTFIRDGNAGGVLNQGVINAPGGYAALIGPKVANEGFISARMGSVALAAGNQVTLDMIGDGLINVTVNQAALQAAAANKGTIHADGGTVIMSARSADALLDTVINNEGVIRAASLVERNGSIYLDGGTAGIARVSGALDASGAAPGLTGGRVTVLGDKVGLFGNARIDVSGDAGGGTALVGGNFQGAGPEHNAWRTYVSADVTLNADAITRGDGGKVVLWADDVMRFHGSVSARGGARSGDGGNVEISGKRVLEFDGRGNAGAPAGRAGEILFDPYDLYIEPAAAVSPVAAGTPNKDSATTAMGIDFNNAAFGNAESGYLTIEAVQALTGNVVLQAAGALIVVDSLANTTAALNFTNQTAGQSVTLQAGKHLYINAALTTAGASIRLEADSPHSGTAQSADGAGTLTIGRPVTSNGGQINLIGAGFNFTQDVNAGAGGINVTVSRSNVGFGVGSDISNASINRLLTTGALTFGEATTGGANGLTPTSLRAQNIGIGPLTIAAASGSSVQFRANNGVTLTGGALTTNQALTMNGDADANGSGNVSVGQAITTNGGNFQSSGVNFDNTGGPLTTGAGSVNLNHTGPVTVGAKITTADAPISVTGSSVVLGILPVVTAGQGNGHVLSAGNGAVTVNAGAGAIAVTNQQWQFSEIATTGGITLTASAIGGPNIDDNPLNVSGATALTVSDTGAGHIDIRELVNPTIVNTSFTQANTGLGNVNIKYQNGNVLSLTAGSLNASNILLGNLNFNSTAGNIAQTGALTITGAGNATFTTGAANATITLNSNNDIGGTVSLNTNGAAGHAALTEVNGINFGNTTVGGNLVASSNAAIADTGALTVAGTSSFTTTAGNAAITLNTATNVLTGAITFAPQGTGNVTLVNNTATQLAGSTFGGNLGVVSNGAITDTGALSIAGTTTLAAGAANNITLDNANNFGGSVMVVSGNNVTLNGAGAIDLAASTVSGDLVVSAAGLISDSGNLAVTGATTLTPGAANNAMLDSAGNNFGGAVSVTNGANVTLVDANALNLGAMAITGDLSATATLGDITNTGALSIGGNSTFTADAAGASISVDNPGNAFTGTVTFAGAGGLANVTVVDTTALDLQALTLTGNLSATGMSMTDSGALAIGGTTSLTATAGDITLNTPTNNFTGAVSLAGGTTQITDSNALTLGTLATGALSANSSGALNLGQGTVGGALLANSGGNAISQTGALTVTGASGLTATGAAITLISANDFQGAVTAIGSNIALTDANALTAALTASGSGILVAGGNLAVNGSTGASLGTLTSGTGTTSFGATTVGSNLSTASAGAVSQTGALTVAGTSNINAGANAITLATATNNFAGAVSLAGGTTQITDSNALTLGALATGALNVNSSGALNLGQGSVGGALTATSNGGEISQTGALTVAGASSINAGAAGIVLMQVANDFQGAVTLMNSGNAASITDANSLAVGGSTGSLNATALNGALTFGATTVTGNLVAGGAQINQTGSLVVTGTSSISGGGNTIVLTNAANDFAGAVTITDMGNISITDVNTLILQSVLPNNRTGSLTVVSPDWRGSSAGSITTAGTAPAGTAPAGTTTAGTTTAGTATAEVTTVATTTIPGGTSSQNPQSDSVFPGAATTTTTLDQQRLDWAVTGAQLSATRSASDQVQEGFDTGSTPRQIENGFSGEIGVAMPMQHDFPLQGEPINTPACVAESKQGVACK